MKNLKAFLHQVLWFPLDAWENLVHIWWELNCVPWKHQQVWLNITDYKYVKMLNETDTFTNTLTGKQTLSFAMLTNLWSISLLVTNATNKQHEDQEVSNCRKHTLGEICISRSVHLFGHFYYSDLVVTVINF